MNVGDRVFVPRRGVGVVRDLRGDPEPICTIDLADGSEWRSPVVQLEARGVRPLLRAEHVPVVYRYLGDAVELGPLDERERTHRIQTGDPLQLVSVLRDLASRRATHTPEEREQYELARGLLAQEIAAAQGRDMATVIQEIEARLR